MTTIAYRDGIVAADSLTSADGTRLSCASVEKVFRLTPSRIIGISGTYSQARRLLAWIAGGGVGARPNLSDVGALEAEISGLGETRVTVHDVHGSYPLYKVEFYALGSGHYYALGAMAAGASAREAVQIACRFDENSGGDVQSLTVCEQPVSEIVKKASGLWNSLLGKGN